jgi:hypothetical protein
LSLHFLGTKVIFPSQLDRGRGTVQAFHLCPPGCCTRELGGDRWGSEQSNHMSSAPMLWTYGEFYVMLWKLYEITVLLLKLPLQLWVIESIETSITILCIYVFSPPKMDEKWDWRTDEVVLGFRYLLVFSDDNPQFGGWVESMNQQETFLQQAPCCAKALQCGRCLEGESS